MVTKEATATMATTTNDIHEVTPWEPACTVRIVTGYHLPKPTPSKALRKTQSIERHTKRSTASETTTIETTTNQPTPSEASPTEATPSEGLPTRATRQQATTVAPCRVRCYRGHCDR